MKTRFTLPTIYNAGGDINKRWHIDFYCQNDNGKLERKRIRGYVNFIRDPEQRMNALFALQNEIINKLQSGWSPFSDSISNQNSQVTIISCLNNVIAYKKAFINKSYFNSFQSHINFFKRWLIIQRKQHLHPAQINTLDIINFLTHISNSGKSNRTRNNYFIDIQTAFEAIILFNEKSVFINPCKKIKKVPTKSNTHEPYNTAQMQQLSEYMQANDPILYKFCRCFMNFGIRPNEAVNIKVCDIDLTEKKYFIPAGNEKMGTRKHKPIFDYLLSDFNHLQNYPGDYFLFTCKGIPGPVRTTVDFFGRRFAKVKKALKIPKRYTMYSLKHTFIIEMEKSGMKHKDIMKITGHKTLGALQAYLQRYIDEGITAEDELKIPMIL